MIGQFKRLSYISLIEFHPGRGAQYCRSAGTGSRIIKFDHKIHTVLLQLPSKVKKNNFLLFSCFFRKSGVKN